MNVRSERLNGELEQGEHPSKNVIDFYRDHEDLYFFLSSTGYTLTSFLCCAPLKPEHGDAIVVGQETVRTIGYMRMHAARRIHIWCFA